MKSHKNQRWLIVASSLAAVAGIARGQAIPRRASLTGGGGPDRGKCTLEVVVDGAAEVEVRGGNAILRNLAGQPAQWRRFECNSVMPPNPPNFRFSGVDGRGSQELVRGPENGGAAVIRIQDRDNGSEGYTFDLTWGGWERGAPIPPPRGIDEGRDRRPGRRFTTEEAVKVCQDAVRQQVLDRFRARNIAFRRTTLDNNPGRQDWVVGVIDIRRGYDRDEAFNFSCSVNFDTGQVRSANIEPVQGRPEPGPDRSSSRAALDSCSRAVEERLGRDGYQHVDFLSIRVDDRPGRNDWIVGNARADIRSRSDSYDFSCSVNMRDGDVRSVEVHRR